MPEPTRCFSPAPMQRKISAKGRRASSARQAKVRRKSHGGRHSSPPGCSGCPEKTAWNGARHPNWNRMKLDLAGVKNYSVNADAPPRQRRPPNAPGCLLILESRRMICCRKVGAHPCRFPNRTTSCSAPPAALNGGFPGCTAGAGS